MTAAWKGLVLASALAAAALGCGVPIKFTRIERPEDTPVKGVRFTLRRPGTYSVSLFFDLEASRQTSLCVFEPAIEQRLDGVPITYEATSESNPFAETNVAFTIDEKDSALTAFTAGATDQLGPLLENLAEVAAKVGAFAAADREHAFDPDSCGDGEPALRQYVARHIELADALEHVRAQIATDYAKLATTPKPAPLIREIAALEKGEASVEQRLAADRLALDADHFQLYIGKTLVGGNANAKHLWLTIVLRERPQ